MRFPRSHFSSKAGFTLLEVLLYTTLASVVMGIAVTVALRVLQDRARYESALEVTQTGEFVLSRIVQKIRAAEDVGRGPGESVFDTHPGKITLEYQNDAADVIIDTYSKTLDVGGRAVTVRKIRAQEGSSIPDDLTSNRVDVTNFTIRDLTRGGEPDHIQILLTVTHVNLDKNPVYSAQQSFETSVQRR